MNPLLLDCEGFKIRGVLGKHNRVRRVELNWFVGREMWFCGSLAYAYISASYYLECSGKGPMVG
jgi:hypothetical protein